MRGETTFQAALAKAQGISIHSPHAGRDVALSGFVGSICQFQSTLPMRGETAINAYGKALSEFQSTLPMRGETAAGTLIKIYK